MSDEQLPIPDRQTELADTALDWLNSTFARTVALKLTPVLLPVLGILTAWLQDVIGLDFSPEVVTGLVVSVVVGAASVLVMYVRNHGRGAALLGQAALELEKLYEAGNQQLDLHDRGGTTYQSSTDLPTTPPGLEPR